MFDPADRLCRTARRLRCSEFNEHALNGNALQKCLLRDEL